MGQVSEMLRRDYIKETTIGFIIEMLKKGYPIEDISDITKKSIKEIRSIKEKHKL